jgi:hypothetical protein
MNSTQEQAMLNLWGFARLTHRGEFIRLRRKGLAILYYLAIEGPTHREKLAGLLWEQLSAAKNLRVELHDLRVTFGDMGHRVFDRENLLCLPPFISLDKVPGADQDNLAMAGLDDLSSEFQQWLERQRHRFFRTEVLREAHEHLAQEIAEDLRAPFVLLVQALPATTSLAFARALAQALRLPLKERVDDDDHAVYYLGVPYPDDILPKILRARKGVYVVERPPFGEDPDLVLALRGRYPPERLHYVALPALSWAEARAGELHRLPLDEAAELYLASRGHPVYLRELHSLPTKGVPPSLLPLPQTMRALVETEARRLSSAARHALERCSVHPGPLSAGLVEAFDLEPHTVELEEQGWLRFHNGETVWTFSHDVVRKVVYHSMKCGKRQHYHQLAGSLLAREGRRIAGIYHGIMAAGKDLRESKRLEVLQALLEGLSGWASLAFSAWLEQEPTSLPPRQKTVFVGPELALLETHRFGPGLEACGSGHVWVRNPLDLAASGISWSLPEEPCLLQLRGHAFVDNPFGIGIDGQATPLELELEGSVLSNVVLASIPTASLTDDHELVLPLAESFEHWLLLPSKTMLTIQSRAELAMIRLETRAFSIVSSPLHSKLAARQVHDLAALEAGSRLVV